MPEINVKIKWDDPDYKEWLCPDNINAALSKVCINTNFEVSELVDERSSKEER